MMNLDPSEILLVGRWLPTNDGGAVGDETCRRIDGL
jgi:hypothetical protein